MSVILDAEGMVIMNTYWAYFPPEIVLPKAATIYGPSHEKIIIFGYCSTKQIVSNYNATFTNIIVPLIS